MVKIYLVGGSVRDILLDRVSRDIDYAVEADSFEQMHEYVVANDYHIFLEKPEFLTIRAMNKKSKKTVDFTLCRTESGYSDYRRPDVCTKCDIYQDLARRDLTINAIAMEENGSIIDPYGGREDLQNKIIRCVGNAKERIVEDPLRILRALRFSVVLKYSIDDELDELLTDEDTVKLLAHVAVERKATELEKMFHHNSKISMGILTKYDLVSKYTFTNGLWLLPTLKKHRHNIQQF